MSESNTPEFDLEIEGLSGFVRVGRGGFGVVYRARQERLSRDVAVKVLTVAGVDDRVRRRFAREQQSMGALSSHPGVVTVFDSGFTETGLPFLVMELMEAGSLDDRMVASGPFGWREASEVMVTIGGAAQAAHIAGVLHHDIKPANILVGEHGHKLTDFGIAGLTEGTATATSSVTATVEHAAPEILAGDDPSPLTDVYSLGSTLFALVVGLSPFRRSTQEGVLPILSRVATGSVPDLRARGVPDEVCGLIERATARDPQDRYQSAEEFVAAAKQVLEATAGAEEAVLPAPVDGETVGEAASAASFDATTVGDQTTVVPHTPPAPRTPAAKPEPAEPPGGREDAKGPSRSQRRVKKRRHSRILGALLGVIVAAGATVGVIAYLGAESDDIPADTTTASATTAAGAATTAAPATTSAGVTPTTTTTEVVVVYSGPDLPLQVLSVVGRATPVAHDNVSSSSAMIDIENGSLDGGRITAGDTVFLTGPFEAGDGVVFGFSYDEGTSLAFVSENDAEFQSSGYRRFGFRIGAEWEPDFVLAEHYEQTEITGFELVGGLTLTPGVDYVAMMARDGRGRFVLGVWEEGASGYSAVDVRDFGGEEDWLKPFDVYLSVETGAMLLTDAWRFEVGSGELFATIPVFDGAFESARDLPHDRLSLINGPEDECAQIGVVDLGGGDELEALGCFRELSFGTEPFHVQHGFGHSYDSSMDDSFADGFDFELSLDSELIAVDGEAGVSPDGSPYAGRYYLFPDGLFGEHVLTATWYWAGQVFRTVDNIVMFG